jgi:hypothetical protein
MSSAGDDVHVVVMVTLIHTKFVQGLESRYSERESQGRKTADLSTTLRSGRDDKG